MNWEQVTVVYAYKRDCLTMDQITLVIANDDLKMWMEVTEDDRGYGEFLSELPRRLPGCPAVNEWLWTVALPPFETQWTTLYRRNGSTLNTG